MRFLLMLTLLYLCGFVTAAQETKKKIVEIKPSQFKETFYVLKTNSEVKHGPYLKTHGPFKAQGQFDNNIKTGVWEYFFEDELEQRIDYSKDTILFAKPMKALVRSWLVQGDTLVENNLKRPVYLGGDRRMRYYFMKTLRYPEEARKKKVEGTVLVSAFITTDGEMKDAKLETEPLAAGLSKEALWVMQNIPQDWVAPFVDGQSVPTKIILELKFQLPR
jgi:periplasmic protein TonB